MERKLSKEWPAKILIISSVVGALIVGGVVIWQTERENPAVIQQNIEAHETRSLETYRMHENITATVFWVGEGATTENDFISNTESYWQSDWVKAHGGTDNPNERCGYRPCDFEPLENPFYFALPYGEFTPEGNLKPESELRQIPWYSGSLGNDESILKNHWIKVSHKHKTVYAQWEDVGPFGEDDIGYVFGNESPSEPRAGLDLSPAAAQYLGVDGRGKVSWQFVNEDEVPAGPWRQTITRSGVVYD